MSQSGRSQAPNPMDIIVNKCGACHKSEGDAPFSLLTYPDVKKRIKTIKKAVEANYMPPWRADNSYCSYSNDKSLSAQDKNIILSWIEGGAKAVQPSVAKNSGKAVPAKSAMANNAPDSVIIKTNYQYTVKGDNKERFVLFKVPFENAREFNISSIAFISENKRVVHHVNYGVFAVENPAVDIANGSKFIDTDNPSSNQAEYDHLTGNPVYYTGWIPGSSGEDYPKKFGWVLPKRGVIIFTVHFSALPTNESFDLGIRLATQAEPIERKIKIVSFGSGGIGEKDITPNFILPPDKISRFELKMYTRQSQSVMYVWPHMHFLGKSFKSFAITPTKDTIPLVSIPDWDFKWQELYRMKQLTHIPAGSTLVMEGTYDNTANNPLNPNRPPQTILPTRNMESVKEMFTLLMIFVPYEPLDEQIRL